MTDMQRMIDCLKLYQNNKLEEQYALDAEHRGELLEKDKSATITLTQMPQIDTSALPNVISEQFVKITELEKKVKKAKESAGEVKKKADDASKPSAFWRKKAAIEALQDATTEIAKSEGDIIDAMNVSFEYQQQLGQITQYLFMLGVSNIAATITVIQQLRLELQKAPKDKMSDLAKNEIMAVIRQLEAQEDMAAKQEKHAEALKKHKMLITEGVEKDKAQDVQISENAQNIDNLKRQDAIQDELIAEGIEKDKEQDKLISEIQNADQEQNEQISLNRDKNEVQDEAIRDLLKEKEKRGEEILVLQEKIEQLQSKFSTKGNKILLIATLITSVCALIISILQLFV